MKKNMIIAAAIAGLVSGTAVSQVAHAEGGEAPKAEKNSCKAKHSCSGKTDDKNSCSGKTDKNSCSGKDKNSCSGKNSCKGKAAKKKDKNACGGKNGCEAKAEEKKDQ